MCYYHDIKICTPFYNIIEEKTLNSIYSLLDSDLNCAWQYERGTAIAQTRNYLINGNKSDLKFQKINDIFTHYLFIDSDIVATVEDIKNLLRYDVDIISAAYQSRENKELIVGGNFKYDKNGNFDDALKSIYTTKGLKTVDWVGAGCLLIKKEVFEKLPYPWFRFPIIEKEKDGNEYCKLMFEDVGFSMLAKECGYKIYLNYDIKVEHLI
jgi:hypothetical protein